MVVEGRCAVLGLINKPKLFLRTYSTQRGVEACDSYNQGASPIGSAASDTSYLPFLALSPHS